MKSKIIHFELTFNGIVVLCEDGSMWATYQTNYFKMETKNIEWVPMVDGYKKDATISSLEKENKKLKAEIEKLNESKQW